MATSGIPGCELPGISTVCDLAGTGVNTVTDPVGTLTGGAFDKIKGDLGKWIVDGISSAGTSLIHGVDHLLDRTTTPNLAATWFVQNYNVVFGIALVVAAITFMIQIISSLIRREPGMLSRAATGSAVGVIGGFAVLALCQVCLAATDALCSGMLSASGGTSVGSTLASTFHGSMASMTGANWLLGMVLGLLFCVGVIMLWITMFLREISIYVLAVFAPIAFAGYGWDHTRSWLRRWGEIVAALIFSKLVIYIIFILGMSMVAGTTGAGVARGVSDLLGGGCLLIMAAFAPWATHRFISFAGNAAQDAHHHSSPSGVVSGPAIAAYSTTMAVGGKMASTVSSVGSGQPMQAAQATDPSGEAQQLSDAGSGGGATPAPATASNGDSGGGSSTGSGSGSDSGGSPVSSPPSGPPGGGGGPSGPGSSSGGGASPAGPTGGAGGAAGGGGAAAAGGGGGAAAAAVVV